MPIDIAVNDSTSVYLPGDVVRVTAAWELDRVPKWVEVRLFWTTAGKGTTDTVIVSKEIDDTAGAAGRWDVELTLPPDAPASYDGRLLSVKWAVEAVTDRAKEFASVDLVVSPTGVPLVPQRLAK